MPPFDKKNTRNKPQHTPDSDMIGRMPPHDKDIEEAVLGALMLEKDAYATVCDLLQPQSFYEPVHQKIYEAIQNLGFQQQPIDMPPHGQG